MDVRLDTKFETSGEFSENSSGPSFISGRLKYELGEGIELELNKNPRSSPLDSNSAGSYFTLYGKLIDGTPITLFRCYITYSEEFLFQKNAFSFTKIKAHKALIGKHVANLEELPVKEYSLELPSLINWAEHSSNLKKRPGFDLFCQTPDPIIVTMPDKEFDLWISFSEKGRERRYSVNIEWKAYIRIIVHKTLPLKMVDDIARQCQNLMSLLIGVRQNVSAIYLLDEESSKKTELQKPLGYIFMHDVKQNEEEFRFQEMTLPFYSIKSEFPEIVIKWFSRSDQAVLASNILLSSGSFQSSIFNVKFLAATQALESYHRSLGTGCYMDIDSYKAVEKCLTKNIPPEIQEDHRMSLENRLKYGNEYSFRKRIKELIERLPLILAQKLTDDENDLFIKKIVKTRNYYTHYDQSEIIDKLEPTAAYIAAERLGILLVANMLLDLGMKAEYLLTAILRNRNYLAFMSQKIFSTEQSD